MEFGTLDERFNPEVVLPRLPAGEGGHLTVLALQAALRQPNAWNVLLSIESGASKEALLYAALTDYPHVGYYVMQNGMKPVVGMCRGPIYPLFDEHGALAPPPELLLVIDGYSDLPQMHKEAVFNLPNVKILVSDLPPSSGAVVNVYSR